MRSLPKLFVLTFAAYCLASCLNASAQPPAQPPLVSPEIHPDRTVTFRLRAPEAQRVALAGQFMQGQKPMEKDESGVWTTTVGPIEPNLYPYNFVVDGVGVADPKNQDLFPNENFKPSLLDVQGDSPAVYALKDVPHGQVNYCYYKSNAIGGTRPLLVYTPPGYKDSSDDYPVFYLVSGTTDTEETWYRAGRFNFILDNLIAEGKAVPMVVVLPYGNTMSAAPRPDTAEAASMYKIFSDEMVGSIMPFVESNFRVAKEREKRAIAGFSRGGGQSLFTAFSHLDKFASIGSLSAYLTPQVFETHFSALLDNPEETNKQITMLWMGVGKSDFLYDRATEFDRFLTSKNIEHESLVTEGGHTWMNARHYLVEILQKLFTANQTSPPPASIIIEGGGSGPFNAIATEDSGLAGITIFRPGDLTSFGADQKLPVLLWGNGACANTPDEHKNFLNEIASHGYFILAIGPLSQLQERGPVARERTSADQLIQALNWIESTVKSSDHPYFGKIDVTKVAAMGMSCGGLQAIAISEDPRIDTTIVCNSGVLATPSTMAAMPPLTKDALNKFHGPVIYIMGGPSDIAYKNAMDDFSRISHVPIAMANLDVGHGGTYRQPHGGEFTRVALGWLDWQLKSVAVKANMFLGENSELETDPNWTIGVKNFD